MRYTDKIIILLNSDFTSYRIAKELKEKGYKTSTQFIDKYRIYATPIEKMSLEKAEMLVVYFDENTEEIYNAFDK